MIIEKPEVREEKLSDTTKNNRPIFILNKLPCWPIGLIYLVSPSYLNSHQDYVWGDLALTFEAVQFSDIDTLWISGAPPNIGLGLNDFPSVL